MEKQHMSEHFPDCFYRVTVKGLYVKDEKVMLVEDISGKAAGGKPTWELPGGGLEFGETFAEGFRREIKEEMNLEVARMDERPTYMWTTKHGPKHGIDWYYVLTVMFRFEPVNLDFTPSNECAQIKFFGEEELKASLASVANQVIPLANIFKAQDFK